MRGQFRVFQDNCEIALLPNFVTEAGQIAFLRQLFRNEALPASLFLGLTTASPISTTSLADVAASEPAGAANLGYARQTLVRNTTDWLAPQVANGVQFIASRAVTFTNTVSPPAAWAAPIRRMFLCSVISGTVGTLFSVSGPSAANLVVPASGTLVVRYEFFLT